MDTILMMLMALQVMTAKPPEQLRDESHPPPNRCAQLEDADRFTVKGIDPGWRRKVAETLGKQEVGAFGYERLTDLLLCYGGLRPYILKAFEDQKITYNEMDEIEDRLVLFRAVIEKREAERMKAAAKQVFGWKLDPTTSSSGSMRHGTPMPAEGMKSHHN